MGGKKFCSQFPSYAKFKTNFEKRRLGFKLTVGFGSKTSLDNRAPQLHFSSMIDRNMQIKGQLNKDKTKTVEKSKSWLNKSNLSVEVVFNLFFLANKREKMKFS